MRPCASRYRIPVAVYVCVLSSVLLASCHSNTAAADRLPSVVPGCVHSGLGQASINWSGTCRGGHEGEDATWQRDPSGPFHMLKETTSYQENFKMHHSTVVPYIMAGWPRQGRDPALWVHARVPSHCALTLDQPGPASTCREQLRKKPRILHGRLWGLILPYTGMLMNAVTRPLLALPLPCPGPAAGAEAGHVNHHAKTKFRSATACRLTKMLMNVADYQGVGPGVTHATPCVEICERGIK